MVLGYLAIDEGTTNTKAFLVGLDGSVLATATAGLALSTPGPSLFEQDADEIWRATAAVIAQCLAQSPETTVAGLAISNQRESVVAWSRSTGQVLAPLIGWQDGRTADRCAQLATADVTAMVRARTGLHLDPMYSAGKLAWLHETLTRSGHPAEDLCLGTVDAFLIWRLTGGRVFRCDATNASRTLLYNIHHLAWDHELCQLFGVPVDSLPEVVRSDGDFGETTGGDGVPAGIPIVAVLGDSHAALYGQDCDSPGIGKVTFGTGSSVMVPTPRPAPRGSSGVETTLAWLTDAPMYAREGNILATGAALQTVGGILGLGPTGAEVAELAESVASSGGVQVVPAFSGLAAPHWDRDAVGIITGVARDTTAAHVARATVESIAHQVADVVEEVERSGDPVEVLRADGGASVNPFVMQVQADLTGRPVHVTAVPEASALGVAKLAMRRDGRGGDLPAPAFTVYEPRLPDADRAAARAQWRIALERSGGRPVMATTERTNDE